MQIADLAVRLRSRQQWEASDLGVRLYQHNVRSVLSCYLTVALPVMVVALCFSQSSSWLPLLLIWWAKPWLDRSILFALARAAFGTASRPRDLWRAQRNVWWRQWFGAITWQRLSPWRALTLPVRQLEGNNNTQQRARVLIIRANNRGAATLMTAAFWLVEWILVIGTMILISAFVPQGMTFDWRDMWFDGGIGLPLLYAIAVLFLEPFYVAAGFAMYLNRRVELEAWDIEQELRRAFAS